MGTPQFGLHKDRDNSRVALNYNGTRRLSVNATGVAVNGDATVSGTLAVTGAQTFTGAATFASLILAGAGAFRLGAGEAVTIATGVATVTRPFVILDAEGAGTTDQLDTITYTGVVAGQLLLLMVNATDTITVDDANINLAAATRAIAPGGSLLLIYDGTEWTELFFTAATDNA